MKISNLISQNLLLAWCLATVIFSQPALAQISLTAGALSPNAIVVPVGGERQITAPVSGTANQTVVWTVHGIAGGNSQIGTIDANGKYVAPAAAIPPTNSSVTVKVTRAADSAASGSCIITIKNQIPYLTSVSPNPLALGNFSLNVTGSRFVAGAQIFFNYQSLLTNFVSTTPLTATGNAAQAGNANVYVVNPGGNGAVFTILTVNVATIINVTVSPTIANLHVGAAQQFQPTVLNSSNQAAIWKVNGISGGNANIGTIDSNGLYTAPLALTVSGAASITATSAAEGITKAASNIFLNDPQILTINRFLDQSTFGATSALTAHVKQVGFENFIDEQFNTPESVYPNPASATRNQIVNRFGLMLSKEMTNCASASFML